MKGFKEEEKTLEKAKNDYEKTRKKSDPPFDETTEGKQLKAVKDKAENADESKKKYKELAVGWLYSNYAPHTPTTRYLLPRCRT